MSLNKIALVALVIAGLITALILQRNANRRLARDNEQLRETAAQMESLREENRRLAGLENDAAELARLRDERSELLKLRAEAARLRQQLQSATNALARQAAAQRLKLSAPPPEAAVELPVITYEAKITARVPSRQTLVTGGWATKDGKRTLLLVTPEVNTTDTPNTVLFQTTWLEVPDEVLASLGFGEFRAQSRESSINHLLTEAQTRELIKALEQSKGVDLLSAPKVSTANGMQAQVSATQVKTIGGEDFETGPTVGLLPRIAADGTGVDVELAARLNLPREDKP